jgi:predicted acetyltransferase
LSEVTVSRLDPSDPSDRAAAAALTRVSFGSPRPPDHDGGPGDRAASDRFDGLGRETFVARGPDGLLGTATIRSYEQWFAGRAVPMAGLASVAVAAHARRRGVAKALLLASLHRAHETGVPISTLYPASPPVYRSVGWEVAGLHCWLDLPTAALVASRPPVPAVGPASEVVLRPLGAGRAELDAVHALYTAAASMAVGPLTRTGPLLDLDGLRTLDGVVLASVDGIDAGYVSWRRDGNLLHVPDLVGDRPQVLAALAATAGSWHTTIRSAQLHLGDPALAALVAPVGAAQRTDPWYLRIVDAPAAVAARGYGAVETEAEFELIDPPAPWHEGRWRLAVGAGSGTLTRGGSGAARLHVRGLAALFTGYAGVAAVRRAGLADGDETALTRIAAAFAGPVPWMADDF